MTPDTRGHRSRGFSNGLVFLFLLCTELLHVPSINGKETGSQGANRLHHFYIVSKRVSDASPFWFDYILDVRPMDGNVAVRYIRIAPENGYCPDSVTVKAIEAKLPNLTLNKLTGKVNLCSIEEKDVDRAIADANPKTIEGISESRQFGIVAQCGQAERLFRLPYPENLDMQVLKAKRPEVAALYNFEWQVSKRAFGKREIFYDITASKDAELQHYGASLVPELRTGLFDLGFADNDTRNNCAGVSSCVLGLTRDLLKGYRGPDSKPHEPTVTLLDREKYPLTKFVSPEYPPLAKMARIKGRVSVEITVDSASGSVSRVHAASGHPLLQEAAKRAASEWKFRPSDTMFVQPVNVVLDFSLGCTETPIK